MKINDLAPGFEVNSFQNNEFKKVKLEDYRGKWVVLFFYPADFTFICPTELKELADNYDVLKEINVEVLSVSTDTEFTHMAWHNSSPTIKNISFPMLADPTGKICKSYGVYIEEEGLALRGTFVIDPDGILRMIEINNNDIGRSAGELIRKIKAAQFVRNHPGNVCPASWDVGKETLKPGLDLVGKI